MEHYQFHSDQNQVILANNFFRERFSDFFRKKIICSLISFATQNKQFDHDVEMKMDVEMGHNDGGTIANATREIMENQLDEN